MNRTMSLLGTLMCGAILMWSGVSWAQIPPQYLATTGIMAPIGGVFFTSFTGHKGYKITGTVFDDVNEFLGVEVTIKASRGQPSRITNWAVVPLRDPGKYSGNGKKVGSSLGRHFALGVTHWGYIETPGLEAPFVPFLYPDSTGTRTASVNDAGWVVGEYIRGDGHVRSFAITPDGTLIPVDGPWSEVHTFELRDINDTLDVVGGVDVDESGEGWGVLGLATGEGTWEWVTLMVPGSQWTFAEGLNNKRQVVGSFARDDGICRGFLYTHGAAQPWQEFLVPGTGCTLLRDINDSRRIVGLHDTAEFQWAGLLLDPK